MLALMHHTFLLTARERWPLAGLEKGMSAPGRAGGR